MTFTFYSITFLVASVMLFLFYRKMALQMQYLQIKNRKKPSSIKSFLFFDWKDAKERQVRQEAFLLFPMLYAITIDPEEKEALRDLKLKVKRSHIGIYFCLILFISLGVLSEKVLPA